jgi:hypothetical protein
MALTERKVIGSREVLGDGQIQVRTDTIIERDGVEISRSYHRHVIAPGMDVSAEDPAVQRIARVEHTDVVVKAYIARVQKEQAAFKERIGE